MKTIEISSIRIAPNRQRRHFDPAKLHEFGDNIARTQLQNAIVLRPVDDSLQLVSGERRLRAIADLAALGTSIKHDGQPVPLGHIPYTLFSELSPLAAEEAELDENLHRENLTWQEQAAAVLRLKLLREAQAIAAGTAPPSNASLALEVRGSSEGVNQETTRRETIVARHLDNPEVAAAKTVDEAFKVLRKQEAAAKNRELGASVGRTFTADFHRAIHGDSCKWLQESPAEAFDVILTDPPYGMGADEFGDSGGVAAGAHGYVDSRENAERLLSVLSRESFRVAKPQAHLYCFCDIDVFHWLRAEMAAAGWEVFRTPLIWYKKSAMRAPLPDRGPQRKYETILYAIKGKRPVLSMKGDVLDYPSDSNLGHAAQKPVALFDDLLRRSVLPGNSVLDPFAGSGTIFPAAHGLKVRATGIEMDQGAYGICVRRIEGLKAQQELDLNIGL